MGSDLNTTMDKQIRLVEELLKGKEMTTQLQVLMSKPSWGSDEGKHLAGELTEKIFSSFNQSLLVLQSDGGDDEFSHHHQDLVTNSHHVSNGLDDEGGGGCEDSSESKKRPIVKDRRGCYKRRKSSQTRTRISSSIEDEHAWRKYGQKSILNCKHQRSYFRCTHKYDQGCKASKQVQRMEDKPELFLTTYIGVHTCKEIMKGPQLISDSLDQNQLESYLVFSPAPSKIPKTQHQHQHYTNPFPATTTSCTSFIKEEGKEDTKSDLTDNNNVSSMDSYVPNEFISIESAEHTNTISSEIMGFHQFDVPSLYPYTDVSSSREFEDDDIFRTYLNV